MSKLLSVLLAAPHFALAVQAQETNQPPTPAELKELYLSSDQIAYGPLENNGFEVRFLNEAGEEMTTIRISCDHPDFNDMKSLHTSNRLNHAQFDERGGFLLDALADTQQAFGRCGP